MKIILLGPNGAGKGTYSSYLIKKYGYSVISTGDLIRDEIKSDSELGNSIKAVVSSGGLVDDNIVNRLIINKLQNSQSDNIIFDGYPRTVQQGEYLDSICKIDKVIELQVEDSAIVERCANRRSCETCKTQFSKIYNPEKVDGICDNCGGRLIRRKDDEPSVVQNRLDEYKNKTYPLIEFYSKKGILKSIVANITPEEFAKEVL
jgi:adenylate kinase